MNDERCEVCGAPRRAGEACAYCRTGGSTFSLAGLARVTEANAATLASLLPVLAEELKAALPGHVEVTTARDRFHRGELQSLRAEVGDDTFSIERGQEDDWAASRELLVRGIRLRRNELTRHEWLEALAHRLAEYASGAEISPSLSRLLR